jgi:hypothetical protein
MTFIIHPIQIFPRRNFHFTTVLLKIVLHWEVKQGLIYRWEEIGTNGLDLDHPTRSWIAVEF